MVLIDRSLEWIDLVIYGQEAAGIAATADVEVTKATYHSQYHRHTDTNTHSNTDVAASVALIG